MRGCSVQVLGTVKNAGMVVFCVIFLAEKVTSLQGAGYSVALLGFSWYQYIKAVGTTAPSIAAAMADKSPNAAKGLSYPSKAANLGGGSPGLKVHWSERSSEVEALLENSQNWHGAVNRAGK
jgi:hypothetical protein